MQRAADSKQDRPCRYESVDGQGASPPVDCVAVVVARPSQRAVPEPAHTNLLPCPSKTASAAGAVQAMQAHPSRTASAAGAVQRADSSNLSPIGCSKQRAQTVGGLPACPEETHAGNTGYAAAGQARKQSGATGGGEGAGDTGYAAAGRARKQSGGTGGGEGVERRVVAASFRGKAWGTGGGYAARAAAAGQGQAVVALTGELQRLRLQLEKVQEEAEQLRRAVAEMQQAQALETATMQRELRQALQELASAERARIFAESRARVAEGQVRAGASGATEGLGVIKGQAKKCVSLTGFGLRRGKQREN